MKKLIMPIICLLTALVGFGSAINQIFTGYALQKQGKQISISEHPEVFWILVGVKIIFGGIFLLLTLLFLWKSKGK